tara:strand:+ start:376 stop:477 length:102 start_codon:yes stop_codon:yes gene_type:complete
MIKRADLFGDPSNSPYVVNQDDERALSQLIGVR